MKAYSLVLLALVGIGFAVPAPSHDLNTLNAAQPIRLDSEEAATNIAARSMAADGQVPDNLFRVSVSFSEFCENGALKARGWLSSGRTGFELPFHTRPTADISLHPGRELVFGPYSYDQHAFKVEYDGCVWTSEGGFPCGWCETQAWSLGELNCQTGQPGNQRLTYRTCYFVDTHMTANTHQISARNEAVDPPTPSTPLEEVNFELVSATVTAAPELVDVLQAFNRSTPAGEVIDAQGSTVTLMPAIIETHVPNSGTVETSVILPFHLQIWEYCNLKGEKLAAGVYSNGNIKSALDLRPDNMIRVNHRIPGYATLDIGPFDYQQSRVRFGYADGAGDGGVKGCEWYDSETWKSCGECRAGLWSAGAIGCEDLRSMRTKDMDCSVLLGTKAPRFELSPP